MINRSTLQVRKSKKNYTEEELKWISKESFVELNKSKKKEEFFAEKRQKNSII